MPTNKVRMMSTVKEKGKKTPKKGQDGDTRDPSELGEFISVLSEVEVKMRLEAMDTFGKWYVAKVLEVDEDSGEVLVHFDRWSSRYDEYIQIGSGRLRKLTANRLKELHKEREPVYSVGDRIQAKWDDGKMYFGKVLRVHEDSVDVLFDDGVEYTAPLRSVRRRRPDKPAEHTYDSPAENSEAAEARRNRARKRSRNDDSASQSSMSSPPSSPLTFSSRKRPRRRIDSDSTETESDFDDPSHPHIREHPLTKRSSRGASSEWESPFKPLAMFSDGDYKPKPTDLSSEGEHTLKPAFNGSESEQPISVKRGRGRPRKLREPYKLRTAPPKLEPLQEDEGKVMSESKGSDEGGLGGGILLTPPPHGDTPHPKPTLPPLSPSKESQKQIPNPTPPETPQTDSHSESGILKRMLSQDESPTAAAKQSPPILEGSTSSSSKKKLPVSSRTRAQTKFENVTKKVDKKDKKQIKTAPKELVIVWDHNEFKCKFTGCNKSFRKESLLQSHIKHYHTKETKAPRTPNKARGPSGALKKSQSPRSPRSQSSPLSPSRLSLSPCSPRTPASNENEAVKSPRSRKPKSILSPLPRRNPSRSKSSTEVIENREKSPTESFFEFMEKEEKSGEVMQLLELATKEHQKTTTGFHVHMHPTYVPGKVAEKGGIAQGTSKATVTTSKKPKQKLLNVSGPAIMSVAGPPLKGSAVEIRALSHDSLPHSLPVMRTSSAEFSSNMATAPGVSKSGWDGQLNNSDSVEEMDTSTEMERGEAHPLSPSNETSEEDVVHCLCGTIEDEGFMIQCEQCLCWQHGDCVGLTEETLPKKYICYICDNPPGLRKRYQYQFDQDWFSEGSLPSLPGGPKFTNAKSMKRTHELAGELYKLRKMMHSSKVKLQAASTVNHPYLKQWAKECVHQNKDDVMAYIMRSLLPVSYPPQSTTDNEPEGQLAESAMASSEDRQKDKSLSEAERADDMASSFESDIVGAAAFSSQNGTDRTKEDRKDDTISPTVDVSSLQLNPLPPSSPSPQLPPTPKNLPDPKSLQLAPLPPLSAVDQPPLEPTRTSPSENKDKQDKDDADSNVNSSHHPKPAASMSLEVFNDEFGVQEMSVFATSTCQQQQQVPATMEHTSRQTEANPLGSNPGRLISSARSAFRPVIVTPHNKTSSAVTISTSSFSKTTSQGSTVSVRDSGKSDESAAAATTAAQRPKAEYDNIVRKTLSCLPATAKSKSGMDSVTLGEFSEAFVKGDTTNWFQRMLLLDHIEAIQDKIRSWMEMIDKQLDAMPDDDSQLEDMDTLMKNVQSSVEQLGKLQQAAGVS